MKKVILAFGISLMSGGIVMGQTVDGIPLKDIDAEFIEIVGAAPNLLKTVPVVYFDFGQAKHPRNYNKHFVMKDKDGRLKDFKDMVEALNFMRKNGYKFVQAYVMQNGDESECHYLLKKKQKQKQKNKGDS